MARTVLVNLDIENLRANLARADQRDVSLEEALRFLADAGFTKTDKGWLVSEQNLGQVDPSEVISADLVDE
jgi:hypothetical protein